MIESLKVKVSEHDSVLEAKNAELNALQRQHDNLKSEYNTLELNKMLEEKDRTDGKNVKAGPTRIDDKIESYDKPILK